MVGKQAITTKTLTIAIAGSYLGHGGNIGDEANHQAIAQGLKELGIPCRIILLSRVAKEHLFGPFYTLRDMTPEFIRWFDQTVDLLVVSGGGVVEPGSVSIQSLLKPLEATRVPMAWLAINAEASQNYSSAERESIVASMKRTFYVTARAKTAKDFLDSLGSGVTVGCLPDATFLLREQPSFPRLPDLDLYAFNLRSTWSHPRVLAQIAQVADRLLEEQENAMVVFLPFSSLIYDVDVRIFEDFRNQCRHSQRVLLYQSPETPSRMLSLLRRFRCMVTTRLHGMILSQMAGVPYVAIECHVKMRAFMEENDLSHRSIVRTNPEIALSYGGYGYNPQAVEIDPVQAVQTIRAVRSELLPPFSKDCRATLKKALGEMVSLIHPQTIEE